MALLPPYYNRELFSKHFLEQQLPQRAEWAAAQEAAPPPAHESGQMIPYYGVLRILARDTRTRSDIAAKRACEQAVEEIRRPFTAVADTWPASLWNVSPTELDTALGLLPTPGKLLAHRDVEAARPKRRRLFRGDQEGQGQAVGGGHQPTADRVRPKGAP